MADEGKFDFIVVGAGPAGASLASRLAATKQAPEILLLEAGGNNDAPELLMMSNRYTTLDHPGLSWMYESIPQEHLNGRKLSIARGKGLGGGTAVNYVNFTVGASADYDRWAEIVNDEAFSWESARRRYRKIETFNEAMPEAYQSFPQAAARERGKTGPLHLEMGLHPEAEFDCIYEAVQNKGIPINLDNNSGNPIGYGPAVNAARGSVRCTAKAYLNDAPRNLHIKTGVYVTKVLMKGTTAVGVETDIGSFRASQEVILSAGAVHSPQLLMLSGIGPKEELAAHGLRCISDIPVGKGMQDHGAFFLQLKRKAGSSARPAFFADKAKIASSEAEWLKDPAMFSGELAKYHNVVPMAFLKLPALLHTAEFKALPLSEQAYIQSQTVPSYEFMAALPPFPASGERTLTADDASMAFMVVNMSTQSRGEIRLASVDPKEAPLIDLNILSHPFDRIAAIESAKAMLALLDDSAISKDTIEIVDAPESASDEAVWEYIQKVAQTCWHHSCSVAMGAGSTHETACLDSSFRIKGTNGLRVVDTSALPFIPNCHVQALAYFVGEVAAEKMSAEYDLERVDA